MFKRIFLFILTNILVVTTISITLAFLGINPRSGAWQDLMVFCLIWGMGGAFISLLISRWSAKMMLGIKVLEPNKAGDLDWLVRMVHEISRSAGLPKPPEVGIYESPEVNAFATGPSRSRALVAFSSGILRSMDKEQIRGVAGHELAHVANGDMVTMTLIQGIVNAFSMFLARVIASIVAQNVREEQRFLVRTLVVIGLDIFLSLLGSMVVMWFSRQREFRADAGSAKYCGRTPMVSALKALAGARQPAANQPALATLKISGKAGGFWRLFASHPPIEERIARLEGLRQ